MSRRVLRLLICTASVLAVARPAVAQTADPEASRQQNQRRQGEVAAQLDLLKASDVQLKAEASRLEGVVAAHEEAAEAARGEVAKVQDELVGLQVEVGDAEDAAKVQRLRAAERAVAAYMHPGTETVTNVIAARDYDTAHKQRVLLTEVAEHDRQVMQARDDAEQALRSKKDQVEEGHRRIEALRQQREAELAAAQANRDRHAEVQAALEARIADFQHEADSLAAQEANLSAIIAQRAAVAPATGAPSGGSSDGATELAGAPTTAAPSTTAAPAPTPAPGRPAVVTTAAPTTRPAPTTTAAPRPAGLSVAWPISGVVTSPFGTRWGRMHQGIDIGAGSGTPIHAAGSGTVFFCGVMDGYGNVALIDHGNGMVTLYAHQSQLACSVGQRVGTGQVIGYVGSTGHSTGPHLHFETRVRGVAVDPMQYLR
ncbi:MAG: peptidoglycan DD-metalloendopeptidase family protein [Acidimicrobiales bacterium]